MTRASRMTCVKQMASERKLRRVRLSAHWCLLGAGALLTVALLAGCGGHGAGGRTIAGLVRVAGSTPEQPIPDARVVIGGVLTTTREDGRFTANGVPRSNPVAVTVSRTGYRNFDQTMDVQEGEPLTIDLVAVSDPGAFGTISGTVRNATNGQPLGGIEVRLEAIFGDSVFDRLYAHSAADGSYVISGAPTGQARVRVEDSSYLPFSVNIVVAAGDANPPVNIDLVPAGSTTTVTGTVVDLDTDVIIGNARVSMDGVERTLDPFGQFTFENVTVGEHTILATAEGYDSGVRTINVQVGMDPVRIALSRTGSGPPGPPFNLGGTVTLTGATDFSGVTVNLRQGTSGPQVGTTVTTADGHYDFWMVPGTYTLEVLKTGYVSQTRTVTLLPAQVVEANFTLIQ